MARAVAELYALTIGTRLRAKRRRRFRSLRSGAFKAQALERSRIPTTTVLTERAAGFDGGIAGRSRRANL